MTKNFTKIYTVMEDRSHLSFVAFTKDKDAKRFVGVMNERALKIFSKHKHKIPFPVYSTQELKLFTSLKDATGKP